MTCNHDSNARTKKLANPKRLIIDYYDSLINHVDILAEESLEQQQQDSSRSRRLELTDKRVFSFVERFECERILFTPIERDLFDEKCGDNAIFSPSFNENYKIINRSSRFDDEEETAWVSIVTYVNEMREEMIDELKRAQDETLMLYDSHLKNGSTTVNSKDPDVDDDDDEFKRKVFDRKFSFLIYSFKLKNSDVSMVENRSPLNAYLIMLEDFYIDNQTKTILKSLIRKSCDASFLFDLDSSDDWSDTTSKTENYTFNSKFLLAHMVTTFITNWFKYLELGQHILRISKQQILSVEGVRIFYNQNMMGITDCNFQNDSTSKKFFSFWNLRSLYLCFCRFGRMQSACSTSSLSGLPSLENLGLYKARLKANSFANLSHLHVLNLESINMKSFSSFGFDSLVNLESLRIVGLKSNAHVNFHLLHSVQRLEIYRAENYNFLLRLPPNLRILKIDSFDVNIFEDIQHDRLQVLDFKSVPKLYTFNAKHLQGFNGLRHLRICDSNLKTIKLGYTFLANLETLSLERNNIEKIDLTYLVNLSSLNLSGNRKLKSHRNMFATQVDSLRELYLSNVSFSTNKLRDTSLGQLAKLEILDLSKNEIRSFVPKMFAGLRELRNFKMNRNPVGKIEGKILAKLFPKLEQIEN